MVNKSKKSAPQQVAPQAPAPQFSPPMMPPMGGGMPTPPGFPAPPQAPQPPGMPQAPQAFQAPPGMPTPPTPPPTTSKKGAAPQPPVNNFPPTPVSSGGGVDLGPVLAKVDDLSASVRSSFDMMKKALLTEIQPLKQQIEQLQDAITNLYNAMGGQGQEDTSSGGDDGGNVNQELANQIVASVSNPHASGRSAVELSTYFEQYYQQQGIQVSKEAIYQILCNAQRVDGQGNLV
jgi:hypothetical protein